MTSVTPTPEQGAQNSTLPLLTSFILIGGFILILVILLGGLNPPPASTEVAEVIVTAEATEPAAEVTEAATIVPTVPPEGHGVTVILPYTTQQINQGQQYFQSTCSACHNMDARGIQGLGKNLIDSEFALNLSDDALVDFITVGRAINDPLNTTGVAMPALGGNPLFTPDQIHNIVAYLRSLQVHNGHIPVDYVNAVRGDLAPVDAATGSTTAATTEAPAVVEATTEAPAAAGPTTDSVGALQALVGGGSAATATPTTDSVGALQALVGGGSAATATPTMDSVGALQALVGGPTATATP